MTVRTPARLLSPLLMGAALAAQPSSSIRFRPEGDQQRVDIHNVTYHLAPENLVLRKTVEIGQVIGDKGMEAKVTMEAWPVASKLAGPPLYSVSLSGVDATVVDNALLSFERGTEEVEWWTIHRLPDGRRLFDTYVPLVVFSLSREVYTPRYAGLLVPPDDDPDPKLRDPHLVAVVEYASPERVLREVRITCDDAQRAHLLRSYWDQERTLTVRESPRAIEVRFRSSFPDPPSPALVAIPIVKDNLDLAHATVPAGLHLR